MSKQDLPSEHRSRGERLPEHLEVGDVAAHLSATLIDRIDIQAGMEARVDDKRGDPWADLSLHG